MRSESGETPSHRVAEALRRDAERYSDSEAAPAVAGGHALCSLDSRAIGALSESSGCRKQGPSRGRPPGRASRFARPHRRSCSAPKPPSRKSAGQWYRYGDIDMEIWRYGDGRWYRYGDTQPDASMPAAALVSPGPAGKPWQHAAECHKPRKWLKPRNAPSESRRGHRPSHATVRVTPPSKSRHRPSHAIVRVTPSSGSRYPSHAIGRVMPSSESRHRPSHVKMPRSCPGHIILQSFLCGRLTQAAVPPRDAQSTPQPPPPTHPTPK